MSESETPMHARPVEEILPELEADLDRGLGHRRVRHLQETYGLNRLQEAQARRWWRILLDQFKTIVIYLLLAAMVLAFATARTPEGIALAAVILVNTAIGFASELKAVKSMEALRRMSGGTATVLRDGRKRQVAAEELVPGDVVLLDEGDLIPADLRVAESDELRVDESALTGESVPVDKSVDPVAADTPLAERTCMLYKATTVTDGTARAVVVATGVRTELGRISQLAQEAEDTATPLEKRLNQMGWRLAWAVVATAVIVAAVGLWFGREPLVMIETAIALGVAATPEGLPIVATIALARGMYLMARKNALVNRLSAVETLGATRIILTDKTGTLTENHMTLSRVLTPVEEVEAPDDGGDLIRRAVEIGVLCNDATLSNPEGEQAGDPMEIALLEGGVKREIERDTLVEAKPETRMEAFSSETKRMATYHRVDDGFDVAVKGAPEEVLAACDRIAGSEGDEPIEDPRRSRWVERSNELAGEGLRVLAVADKHVDSDEADPYEGLRFVGLVCLVDPPRPEVKDAIARCRRAGVRVIMATGDQKETGRAIGEAVGIFHDEHVRAMHGSEVPDPETMTDAQRREVIETDIFARVSPEQKLNLVTVHQEAGETVAMTGDGVNDAPALKKADIGVAMGQRGTEAAKQVSDMVLKDDRFGTIVAAIEQGRVIFSNIRKSAMFMLCTNLAEILAVAIASFALWPIPLLPLQILFLNVVTDVFPALALGVGKGRENVMDHPPRDPSEPVLTRRLWMQVGGWSVLLSACVLGGLHTALLALGFDETRAVTVSFLTLAFGKLWFTLNLRDADSPAVRNEITTNGWVWGAMVLCVGLLLAAVYLPGLSYVLRTRSPGASGWTTILGFSLIPLIVGQAGLQIVRRRRAAGQAAS